MSLNQKLKGHLSAALQKYFDSPASISSVQSVGGGSINDAYQIAVGGQSFFVKVNSANSYPNMFAGEAKGLEFIAENSKFKVPKVFEIGNTEDFQFIAMEFIQPTTETPDYWEQFGADLALMHLHSANHFGLEYDNYMGSLVQSNKQSEKWADFFREQRLLPQIRVARDTGKADKAMVHGFDLLFSRVHNLFPIEPPAAVHGDLWSGNFMTGADGQAVIFDPAVYYGHREMDIAMTRLFGGFDSQFYRGYDAKYPLEKGWEERVEIANLYPLMVHVNLFGGGYAAQVKSILKRFS